MTHPSPIDLMTPSPTHGKTKERDDDRSAAAAAKIDDRIAIKRTPMTEESPDDSSAMTDMFAQSDGQDDDDDDEDSVQVLEASKQRRSNKRSVVVDSSDDEMDMLRSPRIPRKNIIMKPRNAKTPPVLHTNNNNLRINHLQRKFNAAANSSNEGPDKENKHNHRDGTKPSFANRDNDLESDGDQESDQDHQDDEDDYVEDQDCDEPENGASSLPPILRELAEIMGSRQGDLYTKWHIESYIEQHASSKLANHIRSKKQLGTFRTNPMRCMVGDRFTPAFRAYRDQVHHNAHGGSIIKNKQAVVRRKINDDEISLDSADEHAEHGPSSDEDDEDEEDDEDDEEDAVEDVEEDDDESIIYEDKDDDEEYEEEEDHYSSANATKATKASKASHSTTGGGSCNLPPELKELAELMESRPNQGQRVQWDWVHIETRASNELKLYLKDRKERFPSFRRRPLGDIVGPKRQQAFLNYRRVLREQGAKKPVCGTTTRRTTSTEVLKRPINVSSLDDGPPAKKSRNRLVNEQIELATLLARAQNHGQGWAYIENKASDKLKRFMRIKAKDPNYMATPLDCLVPPTHHQVFYKHVAKAQKAMHDSGDDGVVSDVEQEESNDYDESNSSSSSNAKQENGLQQRAKSYHQKLGQLFALERKHRVEALLSNVRNELRSYEAQELQLWNTFLGEE